MESNNIMELTIDDFDLSLKDNSIVFVDFWADWCGPCKMLAPVIDQVAGEYSDRVTFAKVNIDNSPDLAQKYGIQSIPTVIIFKDSQEINRSVGLRNADAYREILNTILN